MRPRSIALVGASADPKAISGRPLRILQQHGYRGPVYPINPKYDELVDRAMTVADNEARYRLYHQAERLLLEDAGMVPLTVRMQVAIRKPNVSNVYLTPFRYRPFAEVRIQ